MAHAEGTRVHNNDDDGALNGYCHTAIMAEPAEEDQRFFDKNLPNWKERSLPQFSPTADLRNLNCIFTEDREGDEPAS